MMTAGWQETLVLLSTTLAAAYVVRRAWRLLRNRDGAACHCGGRTCPIRITASLYPSPREP
jgi:hypothetical protein